VSWTEYTENHGPEIYFKNVLNPGIPASTKRTEEEAGFARHTKSNELACLYLGSSEPGPCVPFRQRQVWQSSVLFPAEVACQRKPPIRKSSASWILYKPSSSMSLSVTSAPLWFVSRALRSWIYPSVTR
jgi:hypothetical protein